MYANKPNIINEASNPDQSIEADDKKTVLLYDYSIINANRSYFTFFTLPFFFGAKEV